MSEMYSIETLSFLGTDLPIIFYAGNAYIFRASLEFGFNVSHARSFRIHKKIGKPETPSEVKALATQHSDDFKRRFEPFHAFRPTSMPIYNLDDAIRFLHHVEQVKENPLSFKQFLNTVHNKMFGLKQVQRESAPPNKRKFPDIPEAEQNQAKRRYGTQARKRPLLASLADRMEEDEDEDEEDPSGMRDVHLGRKVTHKEECSLLVSKWCKYWELKHPTQPDILLLRKGKCDKPIGERDCFHLSFSVDGKSHRHIICECQVAHLPPHTTEEKEHNGWFAVPSPAPVKRCTGACGSLYPLTTTHFHKDNSHKNGFRSMCKGCEAEKRKRKRKSPKPKARVIPPPNSIEWEAGDLCEIRQDMPEGSTVFLRGVVTNVNELGEAEKIRCNNRIVSIKEKGIPNSHVLKPKSSPFESAHDLTPGEEVEVLTTIIGVRQARWVPATVIAAVNDDLVYVVLDILIEKQDENANAKPKISKPKVSWQAIRPRRAVAEK